MTITVSAAWEGDPTNFTVYKTCTANGTPTSPVTATCTAAIPEQKLFYAKTKITMAHEGSNCEMISFQPYAYRKSLSATYTAYQATATVDCSAPSNSADPAVCWGGPATTIIPGFYKTYSGLYSSATAALTINIDSPNSKSGADRNLRYIVNDLPAAQWTTAVAQGGTNAQGVSFLDGYVGQSGGITWYQDYKVYCYDQYGNATSIVTIYITDDEGTTPSTDDIDSWN